MLLDREQLVHSRFVQKDGKDVILWCTIVVELKDIIAFFDLMRDVVEVILRDLKMEVSDNVEALKG